MHKVIITYADDGSVLTPANEAAMRRQWSASLEPRGFEIDSVIAGPLWFDVGTTRSRECGAVCLDDPAFPKTSPADLDAKTGKYILYTYHLGRMAGLGAVRPPNEPLEPVPLRKYIQEGLRPNASIRIWSAIVTRHPSFRTVLTEKQAGAGLGKRLKSVLSRNPEADWQADPGVRFYLLG